MRHFLVLKGPVATLLMVVAASFARSEGPSSTQPILIDIPGDIRSAVVDGDALYGLTSKNELLRVDLQGRKAKTLVGFPTETKALMLTVADGKACVGGRDQKGAMTFYIVDVAAEKITHTLKADRAGSPRSGFVRDDRLYVVNGLDVPIYKISTGQLEQTIKVGGGILADSSRVGDRLYLAREYAGGLGVIDMKDGKLRDLIETKDWLFQVRVAKEKAFVWGDFNGVGVVDLTTRQYTTLQQPQAAAKHRALTIQAGPEDGLLVFGAGSSIVHQYNAAGKIVGQTPVDKSAGAFVGAWNGSAVFTSKKGVALVPLTKLKRKTY